MNARQLKNAILQQAIEGRLVPQNPDDEPAAVLLERIRAEKARLVAEGRIKKAKPLPPIAEAEKPFALPAGWEWVRLGEVALYAESGWSPQAEPEPRTENNWGVLKVSAVSSGCFREEQNKQLYKGIEIPKHMEIFQGDFLISRANTIDLVAKSCVVEHPVKNLILSDKIVRIYFSTYISKKIICIFNNNATYIRKFYALKATGTSPSMKNVSREVIFNVPIPLPPLAEQQRIVAKLEELLPEVEAYGQAQEALNALESALPERLRKSLLQEAMQGRLVPQNPDDEPAAVLLERIRAEKARLVAEGRIKKAKPLPPIAEAEKPFALPAGWEWVRLGEVGEIIGGATPESSNKDFYVPAGKGIPWITPADMKYTRKGKISRGQKDITPDGFSACSTRLLPPGSVVFSSRAPIGHIALAENSLCTNQGFKSIVPYIMKCNKFISFFLMFHTPSIQKRASGTTFKEVSGKFMENEIIPLPPLAEQQRIVAKLEELLPLCEAKAGEA